MRWKIPLVSIWGRAESQKCTDPSAPAEFYTIISAFQHHILEILYGLWNIDFTLICGSYFISYHMTHHMPCHVTYHMIWRFSQQQCNSKYIVKPKLSESKKSWLCHHFGKPRSMYSVYQIRKHLLGTRMPSRWGGILSVWTIFPW